MTNAPLALRSPRARPGRLARRTLTPAAAIASVVLATAGNAVAGVEAPAPHVEPGLAAHQARIAEPQLVKVTDGVYAAVGFDLGNIAFLVGQAGVVVFDTGTSLEVGRDALTALRKHTALPVVAVIYSHGHLDHVGGVRAFVPEGREGPAGKAGAIPIYANRRWPAYRTEQAISKTPRRGLYQMGGALPPGPAGVVGNGGGPVFRLGTPSFVPPTVEVDDRLDVEIAGMKIQLFHAPGDVDDGLAAWLPESRVLLAGDAYYPMFPALSTPRFDRHRDAWSNLTTLDHFRTLGAEHVVPGHLQVISGRASVDGHLTVFRDALEFMHDQTIRLLAKGYDHDEVANQVRASFPPRLAADPRLGEYYQKLEWVVKGIYAKTGGWYGGDVVELVQIGPDERARKLVELAGGRKPMRAAAEAAYARGERAWAAELARHLVRSDPGDAEARALLANVLRAIGYDARSANLRNYTLTEALILDGKLDLAKLRLGRASPDLLRPVADSVLFRGLGVHLDPARSRDLEFTAGFQIRDTGAEHTLIVRRGVIEYRAGRSEKADLRVGLDRVTWLTIAGGNLAWGDALAAGALEASSAEQLQRFAGFFDAR